MEGGNGEHLTDKEYKLFISMGVLSIPKLEPHPNHKSRWVLSFYWKGRKDRAYVFNQRGNFRWWSKTDSICEWLKDMDYSGSAKIVI